MPTKRRDSPRAAAAASALAGLLLPAEALAARGARVRGGRPAESGRGTERRPTDATQRTLRADDAEVERG